MTYDLLVIGGGINGVGIARDAAGRGLRVLLVEKDDLASHTSSWSTKLIHGGLRYLEHYEFRLVSESLREREVLLRAAPHMVRPLRFVLPHDRNQRPVWLIRTGLFLYDHIGGRGTMERSRALDLTKAKEGRALKEQFTRGFAYSDAQVDDSRLVVINAIDAREHGADIRVRTRFISAERKGDCWEAMIEGEVKPVRARALVNAAGPWVTDLFAGIKGAEPKKRLRLVKGSHLVTRRVYDGDHAYIFQNPDKRIVFTIPWVNDSTLIGTTDEPYEGPPAKAAISEEETDYLLDSVNAYLRRPVTRSDITSTFSGVRPLYDDLSAKSASAVTRDYAFDIDGEEGEAPLLSVYGGKLTTYRKLAEHALEKLSDRIEMGEAWTEEARLPGGDVALEDWPRFEEEMRQRFGFLPDAVMKRMLMAYGTRLPDLLGDAESMADLGEDFGHGLTEREVAWLREHEWARTVNDILTRRTKLGLVFTEPERERLAAYLNA
ncbi:glycerol-3-phosphate dehydrogenase [Parvularcula lutaonensis]|uniref:Glycerol-3-phosphate dehydrogenase n=1 Tax=Parvularcula lutaonensis TaxID=491923 RepID=A0ABV7M731_9PROT|nr:glycerol-3-phosphate dehydrogenase [Parvularcula lutaonensis]GGY57103.1 glycerol-3-phosphate dehydrogenase [Parvularcula lutaonensis]